MEHWWNDIRHGGRNYSERMRSQFHFVHHKSHMEWTPALAVRNRWPATPEVNQVTKLFSVVIVLFWFELFCLLTVSVERYSYTWSHSLTHTHSVGPPLDEGSARHRDLFVYNTQHSQYTNIHAPNGIRTRNPSKRAAADRRLRPHGYWDRFMLFSYCWNILGDIRGRSVVIGSWTYKGRSVGSNCYLAEGSLLFGSRDWRIGEGLHSAPSHLKLSPMRRVQLVTHRWCRSTPCRATRV
jgi:hypothetical protein